MNARTHRVRGGIVAALVALSLTALGGTATLVARATQEAGGALLEEHGGIIPAPDASLEPGPDPPGDPVPPPGPVLETETPAGPEEPSPTETPPAGGAEASAALDLGSGVSVMPAEGFETLVQGEGLLRLGRGGSFFTVEVEPLDAGDSAESLLAVWAQDRLPGDIGQATPTRPRPVNPPSPSVVSAATAEYRGVVVGPQVNSPVEGVAAAFVDQNSLGILVTTVDTRGGYGSSHAAYEQMVTSILRGLA